MRETTARQLVQIVSDCSDQLMAIIPRLAKESSEDSLGLYRLHVAAILGLAVSSLVAPLWKEHPHLEEGVAPAGSANDLHAFRMSPEAVATASAALAHAERRLREARQLVVAEADTAERARYEAAVSQMLEKIAEATEVVAEHRS